MSITAIGPALPVNGPLPVAPAYNLLSVAQVNTEGGRWQNGVNVWAYPDGTPSLWEPCSSGTYRNKEEGGDQVTARFDPIVAYFPVTCSTIGLDLEEFAGRARAALEARISFAAEEMLAKGQLDSVNPYLGDTNLTQLGGGTITAQPGINFLENAIGATGVGGVIHATPGTVSAWNFVNLITEGTDGVIRTANGTPVVSGGGYIDTDPVGKTGSDPATGVEWAFATGPVVVLYETLRLDVLESVDREINEITYRAEVAMVVFWDTVLQSGVLIDWTP